MSIIKKLIVNIKPRDTLFIIIIIILFSYIVVIKGNCIYNNFSSDKVLPTNYPSQKKIPNSDIKLTDNKCIIVDENEQTIKQTQVNVFNIQPRFIASRNLLIDKDFYVGFTEIHHDINYNVALFAINIIDHSQTNLSNKKTYQIILPRFNNFSHEDNDFADSFSADIINRKLYLITFNSCGEHSISVCSQQLFVIDLDHENFIYSDKQLAEIQIPLKYQPKLKEWWQAGEGGISNIGATIMSIAGYIDNKIIFNINYRQANNNQLIEYDINLNQWKDFSGSRDEIITTDKGYMNSLLLDYNNKCIIFPIGDRKYLFERQHIVGAYSDGYNIYGYDK